jgi:O-antigen/teichoic acid export membrane protein
VSGRFAGIAVRFGSNLILTRLLMPEAFGLMAIVNSIAQGARMLSDLGVRGSIIQNARGNDPLFLDSAWTTQILRGAAVCLLLVLAAGPLASFYGAPGLQWLIRAVAVSALIDGFTSTAVFTLSRRVAPARQISLDLAGQVLGAISMIAIAAVERTVWALVAGTLVASLVTTASSHFLIPGYRNRLRWEREAMREIRRFGRWVQISTAMTFLLGQTDRLFLGKMISAQELGVYSVAYALAIAVPDVVQAVAASVLLPVYARLRSLALPVQRAEVLRYRGRLLAIALPALCAFAAVGPTLVHRLYDPRYHDAGWMVALVASAAVPTIIYMTADRTLLASGNSRAQMLVQAAQATFVVGGMIVGGYIMGGIPGVILGIIVGRALGYVPLAIALRPTGLWLPTLDIATYAAASLWCGACAWWFHPK